MLGPVEKMERLFFKKTERPAVNSSRNLERNVKSSLSTFSLLFYEQEWIAAECIEGKLNEWLRANQACFGI